MRKKRNYKKDHKQDLKYKSVAIARFINYLMEDGKKAVAERVFYDALDILEKQTGQSAQQIFDQALKNAAPDLEVTTRRIGGANYQVPREVRPERKFFLSCNWILNAARSKTGKPMAKKLAEELAAAAKNEGMAIKKKQDTHRMAEANRAFAHFAR